LTLRFGFSFANIHHAGMLGRKVMISSATITPDLALGFFNAYQAGWQIFAKMRGKNSKIIIKISFTSNNIDFAFWLFFC
jgi:CRISPR/Cas system-associated endonuclease/helicase Cas3